jgi:hypothetical protein
MEESPAREVGDDRGSRRLAVFEALASMCAGFPRRARVTAGTVLRAGYQFLIAKA